jgi:hypothetical protein
MCKDSTFISVCPEFTNDLITSLGANPSISMILSLYVWSLADAFFRSANVLINGDDFHGLLYFRHQIIFSIHGNNLRVYPLEKVLPCESWT